MLKRNLFALQAGKSQGNSNFSSIEHENRMYMIQFFWWSQTSLNFIVFFPVSWCAICVLGFDPHVASNLLLTMSTRSPRNLIVVQAQLWKCLEKTKRRCCWLFHSSDSLNTVDNLVEENCRRLSLQSRNLSVFYQISRTYTMTDGVITKLFHKHHQKVMAMETSGSNHLVHCSEKFSFLLKKKFEFSWEYSRH